MLIHTFLSGQSRTTKTAASSIGPLYFFFATMLRHNSPQSADALKALKYGDMTDLLLTELVFNARSMALRDPAQGTVSRVPPAFCASNMDVLAERIAQSYGSKAYGHSWAFDAHRALALWRSGSR